MREVSVNFYRYYPLLMLNSSRAVPIDPFACCDDVDHAPQRSSASQFNPFSNYNEPSSSAVTINHDQNHNVNRTLMRWPQTPYPPREAFVSTEITSTTQPFPTNVQSQTVAELPLTDATWSSGPPSSRPQSEISFPPSPVATFAQFDESWPAAIHPPTYEPTYDPFAPMTSPSRSDHTTTTNSSQSLPYDPFASLPLPVTVSTSSSDGHQNVSATDAVENPGPIFDPFVQSSHQTNREAPISNSDNSFESVFSDNDVTFDSWPTSPPDANNSVNNPPQFPLLSPPPPPLPSPGVTTSQRRLRSPHPHPRERVQNNTSTTSYQPPIDPLSRISVLERELRSTQDQLLAERMTSSMLREHIESNSQRECSNTIENSAETSERTQFNWTCTQCTLLNHDDHGVCVACGFLKSALPPQGVPNTFSKAQTQRSELSSEPTHLLDCIVCMDAPRDAVILHGGEVHHVCCSACACQLRSCPVCQRQIESVFKYFS